MILPRLLPVLALSVLALVSIPSCVSEDSHASANAPKRLDYMAAELSREIATLPGITVDGPFTLQRPDSETLRQLRLTLPRDRALPSRKQALAALIRRFETARRYTGHLTPDVDPQ